MYCKKNVQTLFFYFSKIKYLNNTISDIVITPVTTRFDQRVQICVKIYARVVCLRETSDGVSAGQWALRASDYMAGSGHASADLFRRYLFVRVVQINRVMFGF